MDRLVYTYALIKSLIDEDSDYLDCFWPFTIKVLKQIQFTNISTIQQNLINKFDLNIPIHALRTILNRARKEGYIEKQEGKRNEQYKLTSMGVNYLNGLDTIKDVDRRINLLLDDICKFFKENNTEVKREEVNNLLSIFITNNIEPFCKLINPDKKNFNDTYEINKAQEELLVKYIKKVEDSQPEKYDILKDMVHGSIIAIVLFFEDPSEIVDIRKRKFKNLNIYFDTNYIFSLLELISNKGESKASNELFNLLKENGFNLKVFDFTIDEISRVINRYITKYDTYPETINVGEIGSSLKQKGWTKSDARTFITNIENTLSEKEITIESTGINDLEKYEPTNSGLIDGIIKYKDHQNDFTRHHDIAAIERIIQIRGRPFRKIEKSKAIFLTSDIRLSLFNQIEMGHKTKSTICEVILDRLMTDILWLKNPNANISLNSIIATHSKEILVNRMVWDRFYVTLRQLKQDNKTNDENISALFYHDYIEDVLSKIDESEVDIIDNNFVLEKLEQAAKEQERIDESKERKIKELEKEFVLKLEQKTSEIEEKKDKEWERKIEKVRSEIRRGAETVAKKNIRWTKRVVVTLMIIPLIVSIIMMDLVAFGIVIAAITAISLITGIVGPISKLWGDLEQKWFNRIYTKKIKEANFEKLK